MVKEKVITLSGREEMLARLIKVSNEPHFRERFYQLILKHAGETKVVMGIVMLLALAIHDYTEGMPAMMASLLYMQIDEFIDAVCGDGNKEVAAEAKVEIQKVLKKNR